jgi:hypothetical protein
MSYPEYPSDEEIGQLVDALVASLPSLVSDLFGKEFSEIQLTKEKREEMIVKVRDLITRFQKVEELKQQFAQPAGSHDEWRSRLNRVANELAPAMGVPEGVHFADNLRQSYLSLLLVPMSISFFKDTNYMLCLNEIDKICAKAFEVGRAADFDRLFDQVFGSEDLLPLLQSYLTGFQETCELLTKKSDSPLERKDVEELIGLYGKVSGDFEKAVRMNVGMLKALEQRNSDYSKISSQSLGSNVQFVAKRYPVLVQDFSTTIRNSIGHRSYFVRLSNKTVEFRDRKNRVTVKFGDFLLGCKLLISSTTALTLAPVIFMHRRWDNIWRNYNWKQSS